MSERQRSETVGDYEEVQFGPKTLTIPSDWSTVKFGEVFNRRKESISADTDEPIKYVGLKHLESGRLDITGYEENGRDRSSTRAFRKGDVLFGKLRPNLNKAAIAPLDGICSSDIIPIYSENEDSQRYLPYLMHSRLIRDRVVSTMEGTNLPRTSWTDLERTRIPLPPEDEQRRIADILSTVDEQIQQTSEIIEETEELKWGLRQDLVIGKGLSDESREVRLGAKTYRIPSSWRIKSFSEVASVEKGNTPKTSNSEYYGGDIVWVTPDDLSDLYERGEKYISDSKRKLTEAGLNSTSVNVVSAPSVMFTSRSYGIGKTAICTVPAASNQGIIAFHCDEGFSEEYLYYYLNHIMEYIIELSGVSTFPEVSLTDIRDLQIPVPPEPHQKQIVDILQSVDKKVVEEKETKQKLQELKRGLMQDLLTGNIRVDPETATSS